MAVLAVFGVVMDYWRPSLWTATWVYGDGVWRWEATSHASSILFTSLQTGATIATLVFVFLYVVETRRMRLSSDGQLKQASDQAKVLAEQTRMLADQLRCQGGDAVLVPSERDDGLQINLSNPTPSTVYDVRLTVVGDLTDAHPRTATMCVREDELVDRGPLSSWACTFIPPYSARYVLLPAMQPEANASVIVHVHWRQTSAPTSTRCQPWEIRREHPTWVSAVPVQRADLPNVVCEKRRTN